MRALTISAYGDVENLWVEDVPEPAIGPGDVKVQVRAASINPLDWKLLSGFASRTFAERVVAPASAWAKLPAGLDVIEAAALPMVGLTGAQLADTVMPRPGLSVLVTGAVGGVGRVAVFVAKAAGAIVWAGVRAEQTRPAALLGADHIVAIDDDRAIDALPTFDAICDTVGGETIARLLPHLKTGSVLGSTLGEPPGARDRGIRVTAIRTQPDPRRLSELAMAAAERRLVIPVQRTFPLEMAAEAFRLARRGGVGKVLLLPAFVTPPASGKP